MKITPIKKFWCCIAILAIYFNSTPVKAQTIYSDTSYTLTTVPDTGQTIYKALRYILLKPSGTGSGYNGYKFSARHNVYQMLMINPIVTIMQSNVSCYGGNNGTATVTLHTGNIPYTYLWTPGGQTTSTITGLSAGTYGCTASDRLHNGESVLITITQPATVLSIGAVAFLNVSCQGGANGMISPIVTGGTTPYTYLWTPSSKTTQVASNLSAGTYTLTVTDKNGCTASASTTLTQPAFSLLVTAVVTNEDRCRGGYTGSATATATGGTGPYTYHWSPSGGSNAAASNLSAGTYTVTVTDNHGCTASFPLVTITQPSVLTVTPTFTNVVCNGGNTGSAAATPSGGTSPYTYLWSTGATTSSISSLSIGTYTLTVHDNCGASATTSITITQPSPLTITPTFTNVLCYGGNTGSAAATVTGGTSPYTYLWSTGATTSSISSLSIGTYTLTVHDNHGCTSTTSVTINQPAAALFITISTHVNVNCNGNSTGSATANAATGGTSPYTYSWSPSGGTNLTASNLSAGIYTITVTDHNGCTATANVTITQPPLLTVSANINANVSCNGGNNGNIYSIASGGTSPYTYSWSGGGTNSTKTGCTAGTYTITVTDHNGCTASATVTVTQPSLLTVTANVTSEVSCNGGSNGSVSSTPLGGTTPYTYSWTGGSTNSTETGLSIGTYTVTVTDKNGCTATASVSITQPATLTASTSFTQATCGNSNGSATVTAGGGTSPYTYSWNPGGNTNSTATGLSAGTYTITVHDNHGCTATAAVTVTSASGETATISSSTNELCNGASTGSATVTVTGGTPPYTYSWNPSGQTNATATGLSAGIYTITVTDKNGCISAVTVTITQPTAVTATISATTNVLCNGGNTGSTTVTAGGGTSPYTYSWNPSAQTSATATGLSVGIYTVTVTDHNGCTKTATASITQPNLLTVATTFTNVICHNVNTGVASVTPSGGTSPYTYSWSNGATTTSISSLSAGTYTLTVHDNHGCSTTGSVTITQPNGLTTGATVNNNDCYNETNGSATANPSGGTPPYTYSWSPGGATTVTATGLSMGNYTVTVHDNCGASATEAITITQSPAIVTTMTNVIGACGGNSNGEATVNVSGGTSPYTYSWAPSGGTSATATGLTGLETYTVTVADKNGCTATNTATIIYDPIAPTGTVSCSFSSDPDIVTITPSQPAGVTINWDFTDINGYKYAGLGSNGNTAYLPVWPLNATITFYIDSGTACQQITTCTYTNTVAIPSLEKPYPRWSKRGMYMNWDINLANKDATETNDIVNYCKANHIYYVAMYDLQMEDQPYSVFDDQDRYLVYNCNCSDTTYVTALADFIYALKTKGGVEEVGVVDGGTSYYGDLIEDWTSILTYNGGSWAKSNVPLPWFYKVDILSMDEEFEFPTGINYSSAISVATGFTESVEDYRNFHIPTIQNARTVANTCSPYNLRVEDYVTSPLNPWASYSGAQSQANLDTDLFNFDKYYMEMEIDSIGLYADRIILGNYTTFYKTLWNEPDYINIDSAFGKNALGSQYKMEIWPGFGVGDESNHNTCANDNLYEGNTLMGQSKTSNSEWIEQQYFDSLSYDENHNPTPVFTNNYGHSHDPTYAMAPDTNFQVLGSMWFSYPCLSAAYTFDTLTDIAGGSFLKCYVTLGHDTQWVSANTPAITFTATVHGGKGPFTYTWYNLDNGRIVYYSNSTNTYTLNFNSLVNNYETVKLGVVVNVAHGNSNYTLDTNVTDYVCIYEQYDGTQWVRSPVHRGSGEHDPPGFVQQIINNRVTIFPNPNSGQFTLRISSADLSDKYLEIYNMLGQRIYNAPLLNAIGDNIVNLTDEAQGIYFYRVMNQTGSLTGEGKLILEK